MVGVFNDADPNMNALLTGFRDGTLETRNFLTGQLFYTVNIGGNLAALFRSNYVNLELDQMIAIRKDGEVTGYNTSWTFPDPKASKVEAAPTEDLSSLEDMLSELQERKNLLNTKLQSFATAASKGPKLSSGPQKQLIPSDTKLYSSVVYNFEKGYPELVLTTKSSTIIHGVVAKCPQFFEKEILAYFDRGDKEDSFMVPLVTEKFTEAVLKLQVYLGSSISSKELKIIEMDQKLVKFLEFSPLSGKEIASAKVPKSCLKTIIKERPARVDSVYQAHDVDKQ